MCGPPDLNLAEADETVGKNRSLRMAVMLVGAGLTMAGGCTNFVANSRNADGVTLFQRGQYQDALQKFQEATYADPNNADGYYNLGATYHRLGRLRPANQTDSLARAETCYRQCLERNANHRDCHRGLAVLLIEENRTPEAFALIQNWAAQSPSLPEPRVELARLYAEFGNKEAAINTLADAVPLSPNDPRQWAALGKLRESRATIRRRWPTISIRYNSIPDRRTWRPASPPCRPPWPGNRWRFRHRRAAPNRWLPVRPRLPCGKCGLWGGL